MCQWIVELKKPCKYCGHTVFIIHPVLGLKKCLWCGFVSKWGGEYEDKVEGCGDNCRIGRRH